MPTAKKILVLKRWLNILATKHHQNDQADVDESPAPKPILNIPELNEISEILDDRLYLSGCRTVSADRLASLGITGVVRAITEREERIMMESTSGAIGVPDHIEVIYVRLMDVESSEISEHFDRVSEFISRHLATTNGGGGKVLVHCGAGISRSASLIMAYLISHERATLRQAYALLRSKRRIVRPNNGFFRQLIEHERRTRTDGKASVRMIVTNSGVPMPDIVYESAIMAKLIK